MPETENILRIGAAYIRVSTDDQIEYSPDSQLIEIRKYAKNNGIIIPDEFVFIDEGISGRTTEKRPEFNRMIGTARQKPRQFDVLLLWKFSRFARNREDSIVYKSMLRREMGIDVVSISEPIGDDKLSILIEAMIEAMDEYYSLNLAQEVTRGMTQRAKQGQYNTYAPFGYQIENGQYVPDPDDAPIVRKIYADFLAGRGLLPIARELSAMGVRTRFHNCMENRTVQYILRNPVYIGKVRWTPTGRTRRVWDNPDTLIVDSRHEPIIRTADYEAAQVLLDAQKAKYGKHARQDGVMFALKGLVKCSCCGSTLTRTVTKSANKQTPGLQCHQYTKGRCPESHYIQLATLTDDVICQIADDFETLNFSIVSIHKKRASENNDHTIINRQIEREHLKLQRIRQAYESGIDSLDEYKENKQKIQAQIDRLEKSRPDACETITAQAFAEKHRSNLKLLQSDEYSEDEKNNTLRDFVFKIIFSRKTNTFEIQYCTN